MKILKKLNKINKKGVTFIFFIILGLLIIMLGIKNVGNSADKGEVKISEKNPAYNTYTNEQYNFSIDFPLDWKVYEDFENVSPTINIYLPKEDVDPPFDHFAEINNVSIFPKGLQTEAVIGQFKESEIELSVEPDVSRDYVLEDGTVWATYLNVVLNDPWKPWGFIWGRNVIKNVSYKCLRDELQIDLDFCNPFEGDEFVREGSIDPEIRQEIQEIIESFRLTEE